MKREMKMRRYSLYDVASRRDVRSLAQPELKHTIKVHTKCIFQRRTNSVYQVNLQNELHPQQISPLSSKNNNIICIYTFIIYFTQTGTF